MKATMPINETDFEPGSHGAVLKNRLGITTKDSIEEAEAAALKDGADELLGIYDTRYRFTAADIRFMHKAWLGGIYTWAGEYRQVDIVREAFSFAPAQQVLRLMKSLEAGPLHRHTPCNFKSADRVIKALAEVYIELFLIHPFRRGNARATRLLTTLMAAQAGLPLLDFRDISADKSARYQRALDSGLHGDFTPMEELFGMILQRSMKVKAYR
jgi:cell filamentation protein